ncbi:MAG: hypothetical protein ACR2N7_09575 [Acidimicrobiia bacterium]
MRTIDDQLREYALYADETLPWVDPKDVMQAAAPIEPTRDETEPQRRSNVFVVFAAAAAVLILIGGFAWLFQLGGGTPPVDEQPIDTTVPEPPPPEVDANPSPTTTVASTSTTLVATTPAPAGEGPGLALVASEVPEFRDGVWFSEALFGIAEDGLIRWDGGPDWEILPPPPDANDFAGPGLVVGGGLLAFVGIDEAAEGNPCARPGSTIKVAISSDGIDWTTSSIELPISDSSATFGCHFVAVDTRHGVAIGPQGIIVTALIQGEISAESIFEAEYGLGLEPETLEMSIGNGFLIVTTASGDVYEIDLAATGHLNNI